MQTSNHGNGRGLNDLYVLPETTEERQVITNYLKSQDIGFSTSYSDVTGQDWYGKSFIEIPFGEGYEQVIRQQLENQEAK